MVRLNKHQYDLPDGAIGRRFVDLFAGTVTAMINTKEQSERLVCLQACFSNATNKSERELTYGACSNVA